MSKTYLKSTAQEVVVKIYGTNASETIELDEAGMIPATQVVDGATQTVNIVGLVWSGAADAVITITRGATIATLQANAAGFIDFSGQGMVPDSVSNTTDIAVATTGLGQCDLRLHKVAGYKTLYEPATYGSYDDITRFGASTTVSGSPDKV